MLGVEVTLLAVYFAGLIFTVQHIAERYSPVLAKRVLRNWRVYLPVSLMGTIVLYSLIQNSVLTTVVFFVGMGFTLYGLLNFTFDQRMLFILMRRAKTITRITCYEDILSSSMSRMDERTSELVWREIDHYPSNDEVMRAVLHWVIDDDRFLDVSWAFTKLYRVLVPFSLKAKDMHDDVFRVLSRQLNRNLFDLTEGYVECALKELRENPSEWTTDTWEFIYSLGNTLWLKGREEGIRDVSPQLESLHSIYIVAVYDWIHIVLESKRVELIEGLTQAIGLLMEDITFANGADFFVTRYEDLVDWAFERGQITDEVLHTAANSLGRARLSFDGDATKRQKHVDDWIDNIIIHFAAYLVEINGKDVGRLLANGLVCPDRTYELQVKKGVKKESYQIAAQTRKIRVKVSDYVETPSIDLKVEGIKVTEI